MPIREYRCRTCGEAFEIIQKFSDGPLQKCRKCGGPLDRLLSRAAFALKGGGWYADGYGAGGGKGAGASSSGKPAPTAESKSPAPTGTTSGKSSASD